MERKKEELDGLELGLREPPSGDLSHPASLDQGRIQFQSRNTWENLPSHTGKGPKGYVRSDERIGEELCEKLSRDPWIDASGLEVEVKNGVVTLSGRVRDRKMKWEAEDLAEHVMGVVRVENRLQWRNNGASEAVSR